MSVDSGGFTDALTVHVNSSTPGQAARIPDQPAHNDAVDVWVDYVVAFGADRAAVSGMTVDQLALFAVRLGG